MNLLLCSSSGYKATEYLSHTGPMIKDFLGALPRAVSQAVFIPYAGVTRSFDEYLERVAPHFAQFGIELVGLHQAENPAEAIKSAQMIIIGGGNTFALLRRLQDLKLVELIKEQVTNGTPYIGWSAGSNLAGTRICTTNDMPIVEPVTFDALNLVPFLINPHFISGQIPGHNGESREQRLAEFMVMNPTDNVVALVEGSALWVNKTGMQLIGAGDGHLFHGGTQTPLAIGPCDFLFD